MNRTFEQVEGAFADFHAVQEEIRDITEQMRDNLAAEDRARLFGRLEALRIEWNRAHEKYNQALCAFAARPKISRTFGKESRHADPGD